MKKKTKKLQKPEVSFERAQTLKKTLASVLKAIIEMEDPAIKYAKEKIPSYCDSGDDEYIHGWNDCLSELRKRIVGLDTKELEEIKEHEAHTQHLRALREWT